GQGPMLMSRPWLDRDGFDRGPEREGPGTVRARRHGEQQPVGRGRRHESIADPGDRRVPLVRLDQGRASSIEERRLETAPPNRDESSGTGLDRDLDALAVLRRDRPEGFRRPAAPARQAEDLPGTDRAQFPIAAERLQHRRGGLEPSEAAVDRERDGLTREGWTSSLTG